MKKLFAVVVAWLVFSQSAFAELQIVVNSGVDGRPVAVPQFQVGWRFPLFLKMSQT